MTTNQPREMDEQSAFLSSVVANPDDVTARLAYADYLDERGKDGAVLRENGYLKVSPSSSVIYWVPEDNPAQRTVALGEWNDKPVCDSDRGIGKPCGRQIEFFANGKWRCYACATRRHGFIVPPSGRYPDLGGVYIPATPASAPVAATPATAQSDRPTSSESASG